MQYPLTFKDYHQALCQNRLLGLKCRSCFEVICPPLMSCNSCSSFDLEVVQLSGQGRIKTYTTIYVAPQGRESEAPYIVVLVELEEGPWIMGNLFDLDPERASLEQLIGRNVELGVRVFPGDIYSNGPSARPVFRFAVP
ncbi:MAG: Zn-ribbon domain-containing OB-fold protein [Desulfohalobiaceae bacterium]